MAAKTGSGKRTRRRPGSSVDDTAPDQKPFVPEVLDRTTIAIPLLERINAPGGLDQVHEIIIDLNLEFSGGREQAKAQIRALVDKLVAGQQPAQGIAAAKSEYSDQYLFGQLSGALIRELVRADAAADASSGRAIYRIWPDFAVKMFTNQSIKTI